MKDDKRITGLTCFYSHSSAVCCDGMVPLAGSKGNAGYMGCDGSPCIFCLESYPELFVGLKREWSFIWPYAILAGICLVVPYLLAAWFLRLGIPSLIGALTGLAIIFPLTRADFLVPNKVLDFPEKTKWPSVWMDSISSGTDNQSTETQIPMHKAWIPYLLSPT